MISLLLRSIIRRLCSASSSLSGAIWTCIEYLRWSVPAVRSGPYDALRSSSELAESELVFAERSFSIRRPFQLAVRVDRVYDNGKNLVLVELKTRRTPRVYSSDVIELSAQCVALRQNSTRDVAGHAYVLLVHPLLKTQTLYRVELIPEHLIVLMARRRRLLLAGAVKPARAIDPANCIRCEYRNECHMRK